MKWLELSVFKDQRLIYSLRDPRDGAYRYVGLSTRGMARPKCHFRIIPNDRSHRMNWLKNLKKEGLQPEIVVLELCDTDEQMSDAEQYWIKLLKVAGCDLVNHTEGGFNGRLDQRTKDLIGAAGCGRVVTPEARANGRAAKLGDKNPMFGRPVSAETREKRAEALRGSKNHRYGMPPPVESIATRFQPGQDAWNKGLPGLSGEDHPMFGKHHTAEARAKISSSNKGKKAPNKGVPMSEEQKRKTSESRTGVKMRCSVCQTLGHNKQTCRVGVVSV